MSEVRGDPIPSEVEAARDCRLQRLHEHKRLQPRRCHHCHHCDMVFSVSHFEHDGEYITSWDEMETVPRYCPWCGEKVVE